MKRPNFRWGIDQAITMVPDTPKISIGIVNGSCTGNLVKEVENGLLLNNFIYLLLPPGKSSATILGTGMG